MLSQQRLGLMYWVCVRPSATGHMAVTETATCGQLGASVLRYPVRSPKRSKYAVIMSAGVAGYRD